MHPVAQLLTDAAAGRFPEQDGGWHRVPPWRDGVEAVLAFTGHAVLAIGDDVPARTLERVDGYGGAHHPQVLLELAGRHGWIDSLDALLVLPPGDRGAPLPDRPDLADHPRVRFAAAVREDVRPLGGDAGVATLSRGIGGLAEISVELGPAARGYGRGAAFVRAAAAAALADEIVVAAIAPGNAASLRAFLAAGFGVVGSIQLIRPQRATGRA